jgi:hypothetical protein
MLAEYRVLYVTEGGTYNNQWALKGYVLSHEDVRDQWG